MVHEIPQELVDWPNSELCRIMHPQFVAVG